VVKHDETVRGRVETGMFRGKWHSCCSTDWTLSSRFGWAVFVGGCERDEVLKECIERVECVVTRRKIAQQCQLRNG
jgi:hypothetical protein